MRCNITFTLFFILILPSLALAQTTDYDGDGLGDLIYYNPSEAEFLIRPSSTLQIEQVPQGAVGDRFSVGDFNGDGRADLATFNPSNRTWIVSLTDGAQSSFTQGTLGDTALSGNVRGEGCSHPINYNPRSGLWTIGSCDGSEVLDSFTFGGANHLPLIGDLNCDGTEETVSYNRLTSEWTYRTSAGDTTSFYFGLPGDIPFISRLSQSSCDQAVVHRPEGNIFYAADMNNIVEGVASLASQQQFGVAGDIPFLPNVDGDDRADYAVYRASNDTTYVLSSNGSYFIVTTAEQSFSLRPDSARQHLQHVPGDYNRDGHSDFSAVTVDRAGSQTTFDVYHNGNKATSQYVLSSPADAIAIGDFNGDGRTQPGVVFVQPDAVLIWKWIDGSGEEQSALWGRNGDQPLTGDLDCDGKDDKVAVRTENGSLVWYIDFAKGDSVESVFGFESDRPYVADFNGDDCDELAIARTANGGIDWWYRNLSENQANYVQWGLASDSELSPTDINGDGRSDFIIIRVQSGFQVAYVFLGDGRTAIYVLGGEGPIPLVGQFTGLGFGEFALLDRREGGSVWTVKRANVFDESTRFASASATLVRPDRTAVPGEETVTCDSVNDWNGGRLWKPRSDNTGRPVILFPSEYWTSTDSINLIASGGERVLDLTRRTCCPNGGRAHYDAGASCNALRENAPLTLRFNRSSGSSECYSVPDPCSRYE